MDTFVAGLKKLGYPPTWITHHIEYTRVEEQLTKKDQIYGRD